VPYERQSCGKKPKHKTGGSNALTNQRSTPSGGPGGPERFQNGSKEETKIVTITQITWNIDKKGEQLSTFFKRGFTKKKKGKGTSRILVNWGWRTTRIEKKKDVHNPKGRPSKWLKGGGGGGAFSWKLSLKKRMQKQTWMAKEKCPVWVVERGTEAKQTVGKKSPGWKRGWEGKRKSGIKYHQRVQ